jgi:hypothetical protein
VSANSNTRLALATGDVQLVAARLDHRRRARLRRSPSPATAGLVDLHMTSSVLLTIAASRRSARGRRAGDRAHDLDARPRRRRARRRRRSGGRGGDARDRAGGHLGGARAAVFAKHQSGKLLARKPTETLVAEAGDQSSLRRAGGALDLTALGIGGIIGARLQGALGCVLGPAIGAGKGS